jgi:uncharacterized RDD family membrane protein YckC
MYNPKTKPNTGKRIGATIIDYGIIWSLFIFYITKFGTPNDEGGYSVHGLPALVPIIFWFCYLVLTEAISGSTLGHKIFGLQVVSIDNSKLKFSQVIKRRVTDAIEIHGFGGLLAFILVKNTKFNQRLGDIWAKTIVIDKNDPEQISNRFEFENQNIYNSQIDDKLGKQPT